MKFSPVREEDGTAVQAECCLCGGEIYEGEAYYYIDGTVFCEDCLEDYARESFRPFLVTGGEM